MAFAKGIQKLAEKKPSVETMKHKGGPIKTEGKKHPKETGLMEDEGVTKPREVKSLADRLRAKDSSMDDEKAYRIAWDIYEKHTSEGKKYKPIHGKHHKPSDIEGERKKKSPFHPHVKVGFIHGLQRRLSKDS
jgi:hypothetical protein